MVKKFLFSLGVLRNVGSAECPRAHQQVHSPQLIQLRSRRGLFLVFLLFSAVFVVLLWFSLFSRELRYFVISFHRFNAFHHHRFFWHFFYL